MADIGIENLLDFQRGLDRLGQATSDFRIPFRLIASDFYRSQKSIFQLTSAGKYAPLGGLDPNTKLPNGLTKRQQAENRKQRLTGRSWAPILFGVTGDLKDSTLSKSHKNSIFFLGRQELNIGTNVPYGPFLQEGTSKMPARPFIFIDAAVTPQSGGRRERWLNIINDHILQLLSEEYF